MLSLIVFAAALAVSPPQTPDVAGVRIAEDGWNMAFITGDAAALDALLTPAYVSVGSNGVARDKVTIIKGAQTYAAQHPGQKPTPLPPSSTIEVLGTTALVRHHAEHETSMDLFKFEGGRWRAVYSQHTAIAPPAA